MPPATAMQKMHRIPRRVKRRWRRLCRRPRSLVNSSSTPRQGFASFQARRRQRSGALADLKVLQLTRLFVHFAQSLLSNRPWPSSESDGKECGPHRDDDTAQAVERTRLPGPPRLSHLIGLLNSALGEGKIFPPLNEQTFSDSTSFSPSANFDLNSRSERGHQKPAGWWPKLLYQRHPRHDKGCAQSQRQDRNRGIDLRQSAVVFSKR